MIDSITIRITNQGDLPTMTKTEEVSAREAAQILEVNLQFLYQLIWSGKLPGRKVAGTWRISKAAIEARLKQRGEGHA